MESFGDECMNDSEHFQLYFDELGVRGGEELHADSEEVAFDDELSLFRVVQHHFLDAGQAGCLDFERCVFEEHFDYLLPDEAVGRCDLYQG